MAVNYDIDTEEFNRVVSEVIGDKAEEWSKTLKLVKVNVEKNREMIRHTNHYLMLVDAMERSGKTLPEEFFYKKDDPEEERLEKITKYAIGSAYPAYLKKMCMDILTTLVVRFDKDGNKDKGFSNFINRFFLNNAINDYLYKHSPEYKAFSDNINDVAVLDKFYTARDDQAYQEKMKADFDEDKMSKIVQDPLFCDVCTVCKGAGIFHVTDIIRS